jgi:hypothetical protein
MSNAKTELTMKNFNFKIILLHFFGILLIIYGFQRFFYVFYVEEILYLSKNINDIERTKTIKVLDDFLWNRLYLAFIIATIGLFFIAYMNWKNKSHINTLIVFLFLLLTFFSGIIFKNTISQNFIYLEKLFGKNYRFGYFTCGMLLCFVGSLFILKSIRIQNSTAHNSG